LNGHTRNFSQHAVKIAQHIVVPKPKNGNSLGLEISGAARVASLMNSCVVLPAIEFDA